MAGGRPKLSLEERSRQTEERFWTHVRKYEDPGYTCWEWTGYWHNGYGMFRNETGRVVVAHRWLYERLNGPVPSERYLDHLCRNRCCVNPGHLEVVTARENVLRGVGLSALNARKGFCPKGHSYDEDNTYLYHGQRHCRTCNRETMRVRQGYQGNPYNGQKTQCPQGHAYTPENTVTNRKGSRECLACRRDWARRGQAKYRAKRREALREE